MYPHIFYIWGWIQVLTHVSSHFLYLGMNSGPNTCVLTFFISGGWIQVLTRVSSHFFFNHILTCTLHFWHKSYSVEYFPFFCQSLSDIFTSFWMSFFLTFSTKLRLSLCMSIFIENTSLLLHFWPTYYYIQHVVSSPKPIKYINCALLWQQYIYNFSLFKKWRLHVNNLKIKI